MRPNKARVRVLILSILIAFLVAIPAFSQSRPASGGLSFRLVVRDSLYPEYLADPFSLTSGFKYLKLTNPSLGQPSTVLASNGEEYVQVPFAHFVPSEFSSHSTYWQIKGFMNLHVARLELWNAIKFETGLAGGLNTVFEEFGGTDTIGFDGLWRLSETVRFFDVLAVRFGEHHFSGHWGDEKLEELPVAGDPDYVPYTGFEEYVRNNSWVLGVSLTPLPWLRLYAEGEMPQEPSYVRPGVHAPAGFHTPNGDDMTTHILQQEGLLGKVAAYDSSYKAYRVQAGAELRFPIEKVGSLFAAADFQFHQDGQTLHQVGGYSPDNPWESEYTVGGGFEYTMGLAGMKVRMEWYYHSGRFPLVNYFFLRSDYVSFGFALDS